MFLLDWLVGAGVLAVLIAALVLKAEPWTRHWAENPKHQEFEPLPDNVSMLFGDHKAV